MRDPKNMQCQLLKVYTFASTHAKYYKMSNAEAAKRSICHFCEKKALTSLAFKCLREAKGHLRNIHYKLSKQKALTFGNVKFIKTV